MIYLKDVSVSFGKDKAKIMALNNINLEIASGEFVSVVGRSGCGKSTLLNVIGGILKPSKGSVIFDDIDVYGQCDSELAKYRSEKIGFVVQHFALIKEKTILENIILPLKYRRIKRSDAKRKALILAEKMDIANILNKRPYEVSGGECQRAAVARALIGDPRVILADEPTGSLDVETGEKIIELLQEINRKGIGVLMVTHNQEYASIGTRIIRMHDGSIL